jgi:DNA-directed RNA polymerase subunit RPC12/RpoP
MNASTGRWGTCPKCHNKTLVGAEASGRLVQACTRCGWRVPVRAPEAA